MTLRSPRSSTERSSKAVPKPRNMMPQSGTDLDTRSRTHIEVRVCERGQGEGGLELQLMWGVRMSQFTAGIDFDKPHQVTGPKGRIKANAYQPVYGNPQTSRAWHRSPGLPVGGRLTGVRWSSQWVEIHGCINESPCNFPGNQL